MDIYRLFDGQDQVKKRAALRAAIRNFGLTSSKRLIYEMGGRPGYLLSSLSDILLMLTFVNEIQKDMFLETLREELEKPICIGHTGPCGPFGICTVEIVQGPTGTYFR